MNTTLSAPHKQFNKKNESLLSHAEMWKRPIDRGVCLAITRDRYTEKLALTTLQMSSFFAKHSTSTQLTVQPFWS